MLLIDLAKMAKIHKFGLANSLLDSPMATLLTLTGTLDGFLRYFLSQSPYPFLTYAHKVNMGLTCAEKLASLYIENRNNTGTS